MSLYTMPVPNLFSQIAIYSNKSAWKEKFKEYNININIILLV